MENVYKVGPRQATKFIERALAAELTPFVVGPPGAGKSAIINKIAEEKNLVLIDHRLSTSSPVDLSGIPFRNEFNKAEFLPFEDLFPIEGTPIPEGKNGWLLFLDEFNSAPRSVQAASYKLILDRMTGQYKLHPNVFIVAAGNREEDNAIVNSISTAMQSRLIHLELEVNFNDWLEDVALKNNYDPRILGYLNQYPSKLMNFNPEHDDKTFPCPRTWEFANRLIKDSVLHDEDIPLLAGTIGVSYAAELVQFSKIYKDLPNIKTIIKDPSNVDIPNDLAIRWATITHAIEKVDKENLEDLSTYVDRFSADFRLLFYRAIMHQKKELTSEPSFTKAISSLAKYLYAS